MLDTFDMRPKCLLPVYDIRFPRAGKALFPNVSAADQILHPAAERSGQLIYGPSGSFVDILLPLLVLLDHTNGDPRALCQRLLRKLSIGTEPGKAGSLPPAQETPVLLQRSRNDTFCRPCDKKSKRTAALIT